MAVKIRLTRMGAKKKPFYRIVAADSEAPRDGRFIEVLGTYDPRKEPLEVTMREEKIRYWLDRGATPTPVVAQLIKRAAAAGAAD